MLTVSQVLIGIIFGLWVSWLWGRRKYYYMSMVLKGPWGFPIIGSGHHFLDRTKELFRFMTNCTIEFNNNYFGFLGIRPVYVTSDPLIIEQVFTSENFVDKMAIYEPLNDMFKQGLFTAGTKIWTRARKHINKAFTNKVLIGFYGIFNSQGRELSKFLDKKVGKGEFDLFSIIELLQVDTACLTTMGQFTDFLNGNNTELLQAYMTCVKYTSMRIFHPILTYSVIFKYFSFRQYKDFLKHKEIVEKNTIELFEKKLTQMRNAEKEENSTGDQDSSPEDDMFNITKTNSIFIDIMAREYLAGNFTYEEVVNESMTMILAAFETTTNVLFISLYLLAINPECQDKLYEEIESIIPDDPESMEITPEHTNQMVYCEMIMNETMRIISPVPLVGRDTINDITLRNGHYIAKGTNMIIDIFNLHRRKDLWGPDASTVFNPDNFLKENIKQRHPYSFVPFTKGIRNCIGWRYAIMSYKILISHILKRYKLHSTFKFENLVYKDDIVCKFKDMPDISLSPRNIVK